MKRPLLFGFLVLGAFAIAGCPIYSHEDDGCYVSSDCAPGYLCDRDTGDCYKPREGSVSCTHPSQCGINETCSRAGRCEIGDCAFHGCLSGFVCSKASGLWECIADSANSGGAGGAAGSAGATAGQAGESGAAGSPQGGAAGDTGIAGAPAGSGGLAGAQTGGAAGEASAGQAGAG